MVNYAFGAGGFKLGERVEILTTGQRGILVEEVVHLSGCNTYRVMLPNVTSEYDGSIKMANIDYLLLRKLKSEEAVFLNDNSVILADDSIFSPKGTDVNPTWIETAIKEGKELIPEMDEAVGIEEIIIKPGMEVWHKIYNKIMLVNYVHRSIFSKELEYGLTYMAKDKQLSIDSRYYALIPMEMKIDVYPASTKKTGKTGPLFDDSRIKIKQDISIDDFNRFPGGT